MGNTCNSKKGAAQPASLPASKPGNLLEESTFPGKPQSVDIPADVQTCNVEADKVKAETPPSCNVKSCNLKAESEAASVNTPSTETTKIAEHEIDASPNGASSDASPKAYTSPQHQVSHDASPKINAASPTAGTSPTAAGTSPTAAGKSPSAAGKSPTAAGTSPTAAGKSPTAAGTSPTAGASPTMEAILRANESPKSEISLKASAAPEVSPSAVSPKAEMSLEAVTTLEVDGTPHGAVTPGEPMLHMQDSPLVDGDQVLEPPAFVPLQQVERRKKTACC